MGLVRLINSSSSSSSILLLELVYYYYYYYYIIIFYYYYYYNYYYYVSHADDTYCIGRSSRLLTGTEFVFHQNSSLAFLSLKMDRKRMIMHAFPEHNRDHFKSLLFGKERHS